MNKSMFTLSLMGNLLILVSCSSPPPTVPDQSRIQVNSVPTQAPLPAWLDKARWITSNKGSYHLAVYPDLSQIPTNEPFGFTVFVSENRIDPTPALTISFSVDAAMPQHGHGINHIPIIHPLGPGEFKVENLLLHMPGIWELYFDISRDDITERIQRSITLE